MALPITVPFTFGNATTTQSLSSLDADFSTVYNAVNGIGNGTVSLANVTITGGSIAANITATGIFSGTSNLSITSTNGAVSINTNGTNAMYINTSQNVGIGTIITTNGKLNITTTNNYPGLYITDGTYSGSITPSSLGGMALVTNGAYPQIFYVNGSERARIDPNGVLLVGTTGGYIANTRVNISGVAGSIDGPIAMSNLSFPSRAWSTGPDFNGSYLVFNNSGAGAYIAYGNTSWTASSDERLKTNLVPIENAASKVSSLRAVTGRFKTDEEGTSRAFLIAQDVQAVLPEAVDSTNPDKLGVQYTEVIPLLVAAIKELSAKNDALEARLVALESK